MIEVRQGCIVGLLGLVNIKLGFQFRLRATREVVIATTAFAFPTATTTFTVTVEGTSSRGVLHRPFFPINFDPKIAAVDAINGI